MLPPKEEKEARYDRKLQEPNIYGPEGSGWGEGGAECLGANNPALSLASSGPEAPPTISEYQCQDHLTPRGQPAELQGRERHSELLERKELNKLIRLLV